MEDRLGIEEPRAPASVSKEVSADLHFYSLDTYSFWDDQFHFAYFVIILVIAHIV